jgi:hypothetical protein
LNFKATIVEILKGIKAEDPERFEEFVNQVLLGIK